MLTAKAQAWAAHMAATGCLCHSNLTDGVSVGWSKLGENVGRGPSVASLHAAFIDVPGALRQHDRPDASSGSASASRTAGGQMWVAEVFMNGAGPPAAAGQPDRLARQRGARARDDRRPGLGARPEHREVRSWSTSTSTVTSIRAIGANTTARRHRRAVPRLRQRGTGTRRTSGSDPVTTPSARTRSTSYNGQGNPQLGCRLVTQHAVRLARHGVAEPVGHERLRLGHRP